MTFCPNCPTKTVTDPPSVVYEDYYHPQVVQVIHPVEVIRRHHCVPIPNHCYSYSVKDVMCSGMRSSKRR